MAKKKAGKSTKGTRKGVKKKQALATGKPGAGAITIKAGNDVEYTGFIEVNPDSELSFSVANQDTVDHLIYIDPDLVVIKDTDTKYDPFAFDTGKKNVPAGKNKTLVLRTKAKGFPPKDSITFKYTVRSFYKNGTYDDLDPDLEVSP